MDSENKPSPNPPEPALDGDDDHLQTSPEAAPPSYSASHSQPDEMTCVFPRPCSICIIFNFIQLTLVVVSSPDDIAPSARSAAPPPADALEPKANNGAKSTMEYAMPSEPQHQQGVDYKVPFGDSPVPVQCPVCQQRTVSKTKNVSGGYT